MALTRDQKAAQLTELKGKMQNAKSVMFAHYIGLTVPDISKFRGKLREGKAELKVAKKSLIQLASKEINGPEILDTAVPGPVACIFSNEDPVAGASIAYKFAKENEKVKLIGGIFDGKLMNAAEAAQFAQIPSRQQLLGIFITMVNTPLTSFVSMCNGPLTGFARALSEVAKKKPAEAAAAPAAAPAAEAAPAPTEAPAAPAA
ncbi:MAG TPA: 50S ribosomal protein L10 [Candidatus Peribacteria bacterium]|nr:50S ribosomal protein L10 [Candidatus Peribacteria bacterium]